MHKSSQHIKLMIFYSQLSKENKPDNRGAMLTVSNKEHQKSSALQKERTRAIINLSQTVCINGYSLTF